MTTVVDTLEVRWFGAGPAPADVVDWFTDRGRIEWTEARCDTYRLDGRADTGVKLRWRRTLEVKSRMGVGDPVTLGDGLAAVPEAWRRWSPADDLVALSEDDRWIDVHKRIVKRRFTRGGVEIVPTPELPEDGGCDIEIVGLEVAEAEAWSFALAAFGAPETRWHILVTAWQALIANAAPSPGLSASLTSCAGYAEWLTTLHERTRV